MKRMTLIDNLWDETCLITKLEVVLSDFEILLKITVPSFSPTMESLSFFCKSRWGTATNIKFAHSIEQSEPSFDFHTPWPKHLPDRNLTAQNLPSSNSHYLRCTGKVFRNNLRPAIELCVSVSRRLGFKWKIPLNQDIDGKHILSCRVCRSW